MPDRGHQIPVGGGGGGGGGGEENEVNLMFSKQEGGKEGEREKGGKR